MNMSEPFVRRPVMTILLTVSAILFGLLAYTQLPVNDLPAVDYPVIQVVVGYPGASPDTIANNIATPLERQFMQINGLEVVTSQGTQGVAEWRQTFAGNPGFILPFRKVRHRTSASCIYDVRYARTAAR